MLPLPGKIPDMVSDTLSYMQLQECYSAQHEADLQELLNHIHVDSQTSDDILPGRLSTSGSYPGGCRETCNLCVTRCKEEYVELCLLRE